MIWSVSALLLVLLILAVREIRKERNERLELVLKLDRTIQKLSDTTSVLASIRVKHGQTWENFLPLMSVFENELGPKENAIFLGKPIDLIYFNEKEVVFVEVKTGNSRLSGKQRHIRNLIKDKKIRWAEVNDSLAAHKEELDSDSKTAAMLKTIPHRD